MDAGLSYTAFALVCVIAAIHVYWGFGGILFTNMAIPTKADGEKLFLPSKVATFVVVVVLACLAFALITDYAASKLFCGLFALIFIARFVGEFNYIGIFKKHKGTPFAYFDDRLYSPLCLFLAVCCAISSAKLI